MCVAYTAKLAGKEVVLKTPLPDTNHVEVAANDLEVRVPTRGLVRSCSSLGDSTCTCPIDIYHTYIPYQHVHPLPFLCCGGYSL